MKKVLVLIAVSFVCWLSCKPTETPTPVVKPCVRTYDTTTTTDSYTETDPFSQFNGVKTLEFKLTIIKINTQTGTCVQEVPCTNVLTVTNLVTQTATVFYSLVGGANVMASAKSSKETIVPRGEFGDCFSLGTLKNNMKVRYN